jgi:hypothetical protein
MKYNVCYNQSELLIYNRKNPGKEIDFIDAILLQQFQYLITSWTGINKKTIDNKTYYWISYTKIIEELPTLNFEDKKTKGRIKEKRLRGRIKQKLIDNKLLFRFIDKKDESKTYWRLSETAIKIGSPGENKENIICYNQKELIEYNKDNTGKEINYIDAILLQKFQLLITNLQLKQKTIDNKEFYYVNYSKILEELPTLNLINRGLRNRLKKKLIDNKLMFLFIDRQDKNKTYWRLSETAIKIGSPGENTNSTYIKEGHPVTQKRDTQLHKKGTNYIHNHNIQKDKRELSALSFFKKYNTKMYKSFMSRYGNQITNFKKFELDFNDTVLLNGIDYETKDLENFLFGYAKGWIKRQ